MSTSASGGTLAAAKLGLFGAIAVLFKKAWKLVIIGVVAIGAFFKRIILRRDKTSGS